MAGERRRCPSQLAWPAGEGPPPQHSPPRRLPLRLAHCCPQPPQQCRPLRLPIAQLTVARGRHDQPAGITNRLCHGQHAGVGLPGGGPDPQGHGVHSCALLRHWGRHERQGSEAGKRVLSSARGRGSARRCAYSGAGQAHRNRLHAKPRLKSKNEQTASPAGTGLRSGTRCWSSPPPLPSRSICGTPAAGPATR